MSCFWYLAGLLLGTGCQWNFQQEKVALTCINSLKHIEDCHLIEKYLNISLTNFSISFANGWETSVFTNPKVQFFIAHKAPSWMHHNWAPSLEISVGSLNFSSTILLMVYFCFLHVVVLHTSRYAWIDLVACRPIGWLWAVSFF